MHNPAAHPSSPPTTFSGHLAGVSGWTTASTRYGIPHLRLRQVAELVRQLRPRNLLDVGCSSGYLQTLLPPFPAGPAYSGIDFIAPQQSPDFPFFRVDLNSAPSQPEQLLPEQLTGYDCITCSGSLEYVSNLNRLLSELTQRLVPGGHLIATYFNFNHVSRVIAVLKGKSFPTHPDWRNFLSPSDISRRLTGSGLILKRRIPSHHALSPSPRIEATLDLPLDLPRLRPWSALTAHQFIYVLQKP